MGGGLVEVVTTFEQFLYLMMVNRLVCNFYCGRSSNSGSERFGRSPCQGLNMLAFLTGTANV